MKEQVQMIILLGKKSEYYNFFDFETKFSPSIIVPKGRDIHIIPIRPEYAKELVGDSFDSQKSLDLMYKKPALLKTETGLKEALRKISLQPLSDEQLEQGARHLIGFAKCLLKMRQEILENESDNINQSINKDAGRRLESARSK